MSPALLARTTTEELNSQTRQPVLWGCLITFLVINDVAIAGRLWGTWRSGASRGRIMPEDVFVVLSGLFVNVIIANLMSATHYGLGLHNATVNANDPNYPSNLSHAFMHIWITMVLMASFFTCIKLTLLFFYKRLFLVSNNWLRIFWWANLVYVLLWFVGATGFYLFQCQPVEWYFLQYYAQSQKPAPGGVVGECKATSVLHVSLPMIFSLISDVGLLVLPIYAIWNLNLSNRKKLGLLAVFGVGLGACLLELARILELLLDTDDKNDASYGVAIYLVLTAAEETAAVVCACLPVIGPQLFRFFRSKPETANSGLPRSYKYGSSNNGGSGGARSRRLRTDGFRRFGDSANHVGGSGGSGGRGDPLATNFTLMDDNDLGSDELRDLKAPVGLSGAGAGGGGAFRDDVHLTTIEVAGGRGRGVSPGPGVVSSGGGINSGISDDESRRHQMMASEDGENPDEIGLARAPGIYVRTDVQVVHSDMEAEMGKKVNFPFDSE